MFSFRAGGVRSFRRSVTALAEVTIVVLGACVVVSVGFFL